MTDAERARRAARFLELLSSHRDSEYASNALVSYVYEGVEADRLQERELAALDRVLVDHASGEIDGLLADLGIDEVVLRRDT